MKWHQVVVEDHQGQEVGLHQQEQEEETATTQVQKHHSELESKYF
jgi:hypothetical protein